ncbi:MAG: MFS transporter [Burkholderiaceae bacterium]
MNPPISPVGSAVAAGAAADRRVIGLIALVHGLSHFFHLILAPLFPWLKVEFGLSYTELGLLVTVFFVVSGICQSIAGFLVDRFGGVPVLMTSLAMFAIGALLLGTATSYWQLAAGMAICGLGNAPFHPIDFSIMNARIRPARLGRAYAVHGISGNLGWAAAPLFLVGITSATGDWRMAHLGAAALAGAALVLVIWQRAALADRAGAPAATPAVSADPANNRATAPELPTESPYAFLKLPAVWLSFLFFAVYAFALGGIQSFAPAAAGALHALDPVTIGYCLTAYMVFAALGMLPGGFVAGSPDGAERLIAIGFGGAALAALSMLLIDWPAWMVPGVFAVMGFSAGFANPSRDLLVKRAAPPGATGRVYGVVYSGLDVGMAIGPALFGWMMDLGRPSLVWISIVVLQFVMIGCAFLTGSASRVDRTGTVAQSA